jgi:hypothetical protein
MSIDQNGKYNGTSISYVFGKRDFSNVTKVPKQITAIHQKRLSWVRLIR